jgi:ABC-type methionine transport system ATPase subunit
VRVINLLQRPTSGNVIIDGQDITSYSGTALAEERKRMGMIFQHFNLIGGSTVGENVAFNLKAGGWKKAEIPGRVKDCSSWSGWGTGKSVSVPAVRWTETAGGHRPCPSKQSGDSPL